MELNPYRISDMNYERVLGAIGGHNSTHAAILAVSIGVPGSVFL
jgi:hypothetical protein